MVQTVHQNLGKIRRLINAQEFVPLAEVEDLPGLLIERDEGTAILSAWGQLCWSKAKPILYGERIYDTQHSNLKLSKKFIKSGEKQPSDRKFRSTNDLTIF